MLTNSAFFIFLEKVSAKFSDLIFAVSRKIVNSVIDEKVCKEDKIRYMGFGINIARFDPSKFSKEFILQKKKQLGIDPSKRVIGIVARLVAEKGYMCIGYRIWIRHVHGLHEGKRF